uniref:Uncharacterized protein n=1 Tax=Fagus sylvatica TaxID=28930 RepID=A0A2N9FGS9_FAGSY
MIFITSPGKETSKEAIDYPLSTRGDYSLRCESPADGRSAKYSAPEEGPREGSACILESPLSSEKPKRKGGSRNSKKNSNS